MFSKKEARRLVRRRGPLRTSSRRSLGGARTSFEVVLIRFPQSPEALRLLDAEPRDAGIAARVGAVLPSLLDLLRDLATDRGLERNGLRLIFAEDLLDEEADRPGIALLAEVAVSGLFAAHHGARVEVDRHLFPVVFHVQL